MSYKPTFPCRHLFSNTVSRPSAIETVAMDGDFILLEVEAVHARMQTLEVGIVQVFIRLPYTHEQGWERSLVGEPEASLVLLSLWWLLPQIM